MRFAFIARWWKSIPLFRRSGRIWAPRWLVVVHRYLGVALTSEAFASAEHPDDDAKRTAASIAHWTDTTLTPAMNIKQAVATFDRTESEALAVVEDLTSGKVIGLLTEGYALRRYAEELEQARQGITGGS